MKRELPDEVIHPKDFSRVLAKFNIPIGEQDWWLMRWGMIVSVSLLSVVCFYAALVSGQMTLFQLLLRSLSVLGSGYMVSDGCEWYGTRSRMGA